MFDLRQWLAQTGEHLGRSLEGSWRHGQETWLPALGAQQGSHNGIPHLRNTESYLNRVCQAFHMSGSSNQTNMLELSPVEAYILLAAILFHDIGRLEVDSGHGTHSRKILQEHWPKYGIPSNEMANLIGQIAEYHAPSENKPRSELATALTVTSLAPYGRIRLREMAALLRLIDEMDGAFTRVLPEYLRTLKPDEPPGVFRALVHDVEVNASSQTIYTVLGDGISNITYPEAESSTYYYKQNEKRIKNPKSLPLRGKGNDFELQLEDLKGHDIGDRLSEVLTREDPIRLPSLVGHVEDREGPPFLCVEWLLTAGLIHVDEKKRCKRAKGWNRRMLLAALMANLRKSNEVLAEERTVLIRLGIHLQGWVLESKEHLYDESGTETMEAVLYKDYLEDIASRMWELSTQVFGRADYTYKELAVAARETDVNKVRVAVNRLAVLTEHWTGRAGAKGGIWAGPNEWRWIVRHEEIVKSKRQCDFLTMKNIRDIMKNVHETRSGEFS